jgi:mRNA-degrading endonuclease RelE of RelBE toxin-antitoxin system
MVARKRGSKKTTSPADRQEPWRIRYSRRILDEDLHEIGHAALQTARKAIEKKLRIDPEQYGERLRPPLAGLYKLKSSHVRVAYHVQHADREVWVLMIADRRVIWDRHEREIFARLHGSGSGE